MPCITSSDISPSPKVQQDLITKSALRKSVHKTTVIYTYRNANPRSTFVDGWSHCRDLWAHESQRGYQGDVGAKAARESPPLPPVALNGDQTRQPSSAFEDLV